MSLPAVPTGIQRLLHLASVDAAFARELEARRDELADAAGVALTDQERAILRAIPAAQLALMIARLPPPAPARRTFFRQAAASAVLLLGGAALTGGCRDSATPTDAGDDVPERQDHVFYADGALADVPHDVPEDVVEREDHIYYADGAHTDVPDDGQRDGGPDGATDGPSDAGQDG